MAQIFMVFVDKYRLYVAITKIGTQFDAAPCALASACYVSLWSHWTAGMKFRTMKFSFEGATLQNFAPAKISRYTVLKCNA